MEDEKITPEISFDDILTRAKDAVKIVTEKEVQHRSKSVKKLSIPVQPDDVPIKVKIVEKLNEKGIRYQDLLNFCIDYEGGDSKTGLSLGNNIINCLRTRNTLSLNYLQILCDFLKLEIRIVDVSKKEE
jgi:hypothetical protein